MQSNTTISCIGRYCGYPPEPGQEGVWQMDKCEACPWGFRSNDTKFCVKCVEPPELYDWMYLGFMCLLSCTLHWLYILQNKNEAKITAVQLILSFSESGLAAVLALLSSEPRGQLQLISCGVKQLSDWYTMFYNPQIRYTETIHCTQEAVYPLSMIVCIYYAFSLVLMLVFRPIIMSSIAPSKKWRDPIYAALYFHPILVVVHAFVGGLIYYAFPYITVLSSVFALAAYFVWTYVINLRALFMPDGLQNFLVIMWHYSLLAYGIVAISIPIDAYYFVSLVPVPLLFYFLTVHFTDPDNINLEMH